MFQGAVEAVPKVLTKDTGIVLELLEIPQKTQMWAELRNPVSSQGKMELAQNQNSQAWRVPEKKEERFWQSLTNSLVLFWTFAPDALWGGDEESKSLFASLPFSLSSEAPLSEVNLSATDVKIKLMELAAPAAHRDRGDTQLSGEGKESEGSCSGLSMSHLDLSHHPGSNHADLQPALPQPPIWAPSFQTCSLHCGWSPLQSTPPMRLLPWLSVFKVLLWDFMISP